MDLNAPFQSKTFKGILYGVGIFIVLLIVFQFGVFVGFRKATFSYRWGANYYNNFGDNRHEFLRDFQGKDFLNSHGVTGAILKVEAPKIMIKGMDGVEKVVLTTSATEIKRGRQNIKIEELKANDQIVVIGSPDDAGEIQANLIRILPMGVPPQGMMPMMPVPMSQQLLQPLLQKS